MTIVIGYMLAILIGASLGLIGGGGSILTVPVLVYLMKVDPVLATTYSLFIVGITSLTGGVKAYIQKQVDFKAVSLFGIPSILTIFVARHFILPAIPEQIGPVGPFMISRGSLLMIIFALLMLVAALSMMTYQQERKEDMHAGTHNDKTFALLIPGLFVGLVTGLLGAGGGFLIIPALVLIIRLPMKIAVGTSLLIIAINSIFGFVFSIGHFKFEWKLLLSFSALSVLGVFIGSRLSQKIDGNTLKKIFGWFVLVMSVYIIFRELLLH